jgi:hypothetical protein
MRTLAAALTVFVVSACTSQRPDTVDHASATDTALRTELLHRAATDSAVREAFTAGYRAGSEPDAVAAARVIAIDSANTAWLAAVVARHGWPGRRRVGQDGTDAAFLLVQHADRDTAFQVRTLPMLERAYRSGEASGHHVALLTDRVATARGEPQVYGTQADVRNGHPVIKTIADSAGVDRRRAAVGLPPLAEYLRILESVYGAKPVS